MGGLSPESAINITWRTGGETRGGSGLISKCLLLQTFDYRTIDQSILLDRSSPKKEILHGNSIYETATSKGGRSH